MSDLLVVNTNESSVRARGTGWSDLAGMTASLGCAIHCAAMPFVIGYLPSLGLSFMAGERFHQWMAVICAGIAFIAFVPGWRRHRHFAPVILGMIGVCFLSSAAFVLEPCCETCAVTSRVRRQVDSSIRGKTERF